MNVQNLLDTARAAKATALSDAMLMQYLNEIEGRVQTEVMGIAPEDTVEHESGEEKLLVGAPHDKLYFYYLLAMIDFGEGSYQKYENGMEMANAAFSEWAKWWQRTR